jgi:DNA-binding CsgD family transcriptional regulator/tetratricopeptide (TPR) repeat protein
LAGIDTLVAGSFLYLADDPHGDPRYMMLETIREFALEHLAESGELEVIRRRHAAWYVALAEEAEEALRGGPLQAHWLARLEPELPNLRGALGWLEASGDIEAMMRLAGALGGFWFWGSHRREGAAWLERALAAADETPTPGRGKALLVLGLQGMEQGSAQAADYAAESAAVWDTMGDSWRAADARLALGQILEYRADYERAIPLLEESAQYWEEQGEPGRMATALSFLGQAALDHDDGLRANALFREAINRFQQSGYAWGISTAHHQLGEVAALQGDVQAAAMAYATSFDETGSQENLVGKLVAVGRLAAVSGRAKAAARLLGAAEAIAETIGYVRRQPEQDRLERDAAHARAALGGAEFDKALELGRALSPDRAVAETLAVLNALGVPAAPGATPAPRTPLSSLTPREREVLDLMCLHLQDREIADRLFLSPRTVESHVSHIFDKLGVRSRREAITMATSLAPL